MFIKRSWKGDSLLPRGALLKIYLGICFETSGVAIGISTSTLGAHLAWLSNRSDLSDGWYMEFMGWCVDVPLSPTRRKVSTAAGSDMVIAPERRLINISGDVCSRVHRHTDTDVDRHPDTVPPCFIFLDRRKQHQDTFLFISV